MVVDDGHLQRDCDYDFGRSQRVAACRSTLQHVAACCHVL